MRQEPDVLISGADDDRPHSSGEQAFHADLGSLRTDRSCDLNVQGSRHEMRDHAREGGREELADRDGARSVSEQEFRGSTGVLGRRGKRDLRCKGSCPRRDEQREVVDDSIPAIGVLYVLETSLVLR